MSERYSSRVTNKVYQRMKAAEADKMSDAAASATVKGMAYLRLNKVNGKLPPKMGKLARDFLSAVRTKDEVKIIAALDRLVGR